MFNNRISTNEMYNGIKLNKIMESWKPQLDACKACDANFTQEQGAKLALMLENTKDALTMAERKYESTQPLDIGPFKKHAFDILTAVMPNLIAEEIVSVQPMSQKVAQIFFLKYVYGSNKGRTKKGDTMNSWHSAQMGADINYSSEIVEHEILAQSGETTYEGNFDYIPMRPGTIEITVGSKKFLDDGKGNITGAGLTTGTVDYASGRYELEFSDNTEENLEANYEFDLEIAPSTIPQVDIKVEETIVTARPRKLRALYSFDAGYDLKMSQGIDIDDSLLEATVHELKAEIDGEIMMDLYNQAGLTSTWNMKYNPTEMNVSQRDHRLTFIDEITSASNAMFQATRRATGNFIIVGKWGADILQSLGAPRFVSSGVTNPVGPHFYGTLDGKYKVYNNPYYAENQYLVGYKGQNLLDAGYIYAPYLPIFASQLLMLDDFVGRRGFASSYGKRMVNSNLYVKGIITNS